MRAARIIGPRQFEVCSSDSPQADGTKVLVRISYCGICGSDLHLWVNGAGFGGVPDFVPGHEISATVIDPGSRDDLKEGDRVTVIPFNGCGECPMCRQGYPALCFRFAAGDPNCMCPGVNAPGAYAEYLSARPDMVRKLPENISGQEGAMIEPAAVGCHAVRCAGIRPGETVLINGGGIIGLLCAAWARINGARYIALAEANDLRGQNALKMGDIDAYFDVKDQEYLPKLMDASGGGFDFALETSATDAGINAAFMALKPHGTFVMIGVNEKPSSVMTVLEMVKELNHKSSFGYTVEEFDMTLDLMGKRRLDAGKFISGTCGLDGVQAAFENLSSGKGSDVKIIIQP